MVAPAAVSVVAAPSVDADGGVSVNLGGISGAGGATGAAAVWIGVTPLMVSLAAASLAMLSEAMLSDWAARGLGIALSVDEMFDVWPLEETTGRPTRADVVAASLDGPGAGAFGQRLERFPR